MAKEQQSSENSPGVCGKIYKATIGTVLRISHCSQVGTAPSPPQPTADEAPTTFGDLIPIEFDPSLPRTSSNNKVETGPPKVPPAGLNKEQDKGKPSKNMGQPGRMSNIESGPGELGQAGAEVPDKKIAAKDFNGGGGGGGGGGGKLEQDSVSDSFSDYIKRVRNKLKNTASNIGRTKSSVRWDSFNDKVSDYINHAKLKIRTTSSVGGGTAKPVSSK